MSQAPTDDTPVGDEPTAEEWRQCIQAQTFAMLSRDARFTVDEHPGRGPGHDVLLVAAGEHVYAIIVRELDATVRGEKIRLTYWPLSGEEGGRK